LNRPSTPRVAILGGGLSGLATATHLHLADPSLSVRLFEARSRVGGVIYTEVVDDFVIDHGADMFATQPLGAMELVRAIGLEDRLIEPEPTRRGARIVRGGRLVPVPDGFVLMRATQWFPMMTTPLLSVHGKLRFLAERFVRPLAEDRDESVSEFVARRMGKEVLDRIVAPLSAGIYTADITKLSMRATMAPIAKMERKYGSLAKAAAVRRKSGEDSIDRSSAGARYGKFRALRGGMRELIDSMAVTLPEGTICCDHPVDSLQRRGDSWHIHSRGKSAEFDHVVVATPPQIASDLLRPLSEVAANEMSAIEMASTAIVVMAVPKANITGDIETFGFVVPLHENRRILAGSFASHKFAGRAPEDHVLIRVFIGGAMQPELLRLSDEELVQVAREELGELIGLHGDPTLVRVVRWNDAMPQYHIGHLDRVERIEREIAKIDGLSLVNNGLHGVGIAPLIGLAQKVAADVVTSFTRSGDASSSDGVRARSTAN